MSRESLFHIIACALLFTIIAIASSKSMADTLWMSDGSTVEFQDTKKVAGVMIPDSSFGDQAYEGAVDHDAYFGTYQLPVDVSSYVSVEAEWGVFLPADFSGVADEHTKVILQGVIDTKFFSEFLKDQTLWLPASIGNNLIASGEGIETTLGALKRGEIDAVINVRYQDVEGRDQEFSSNSQSLENLPLIELVNGVLNIDSSVNWVNLGAIEESSAFVNDKSIRTSAILRSIAELPLSGLPLCMDSIKLLTLKNISRHVINKGKYMAGGASMEVLDQNGDQVGDGHVFF